MPQDVKLSPTAAPSTSPTWRPTASGSIDARRMRRDPLRSRTGAGAHGLYPSRDSRVLYVSNRGEGSITVISFRTRRPVEKWRLPGGGSPDMGGVSADGTVLWLSRPLRRRGLRDQHPHGPAAAPHPGRPGPARAGGLAAARPLLDRPHRHPALSAARASARRSCNIRWLVRHARRRCPTMPRQQAQCTRCGTGRETVPRGGQVVVRPPVATLHRRPGPAPSGPTTVLIAMVPTATAKVPGLRPALCLALLVGAAVAWPAAPSRAGTLVTYAPAADAAVSPIYRKTPYGKREWLRVGGQGRWRSYLTFKVPGPAGPSARAILLLRARNVPRAGFDVDTVLGARSAAWSDRGHTASRRLHIGNRAWRPGARTAARRRARSAWPTAASSPST